MAIDFPDTRINNPETGLPWVNGDTFTDIPTGLTYYWFDPVWKREISVTGATDEKYVERAGDNMTGNLTLGDGTDDKITLDATDGSAEFAGEIRTPGEMVGVPFKNVYSASGNSPIITIQSKEPDVNVGAAAFEVRTWNSAESTVESKIRFNHSGSSTFAGNVQTGNSPINAGLGALQTANGQFWAATANGANLFTGFLAGNTTPKVTIASNGSAEFAGGLVEIDNTQIYIKSDSTANAYCQLGRLGFLETLRSGTAASAPNDLAYRARYKIDGTISDVIKFNYDGSATFATTVNANTANATDDITVPGAFLSSAGSCYAIRPASDGNLKVWGGFLEGSAEPTSEILANGSATFAGTVITKQVSSSSTNGADKIFTGGITNSSENFFVKADGSALFKGNVGVGTTSPAQALEVNGNIQVGDTASSGARVDFGSASTRIQHDGADNLSVYSNGAEAARIDSSGRLLLGVPDSITNAGKFQIKTRYDGSLNQQGVSFLHTAFSPLDTFNLNFLKSRDNFGGDTPVISGTRLGQINFKGYDGTDYESVGASIYAEVDGTPGSNDMPGRLVFSTTKDGASSTTERMRIDDEGTIYHNSSNHGIGSFITQSAGTVKYIFRGHYGSPSGNYGGTICFTVWSNGNVENLNNSYGAISDIKLKENIVPALSQWENIKNIEVVNYNFKEETGYETHKQLGVIAQQVERVSPGLVETDEDGLKSVHYSVLYMKSVKALQEAMTRIESLETRVSQADNALIALKSAAEAATDFDELKAAIATALADI